MRLRYLILLIIMLFISIFVYRETPSADPEKKNVEPQYLSPSNLLLYTEKGSANDSIENFFSNIYLNKKIIEDFARISEHSIEKYKEGIKNTMGTRLGLITNFSIISEEIEGDRAIVRHSVTYDNNATIEDQSYFIYRNGRWYFDFEKEMR